MNCNSTIQVELLIGSTAHTREASQALIEAISSDPCKNIELDFTNVEFISRSFADQFHFEKLQVSEKENKMIIVKNANEPVFNMLQAVAKTQQKNDRVFHAVPVYKYSSVSEIKKFLLAI